MEEKPIEKNERSDKNMAPACRGCVRWDRFGKSCFYYWENKKHCTMWAGSWDEVVVQ